MKKLKNEMDESLQISWKGIRKKKRRMADEEKNSKQREMDSYRSDGRASKKEKEGMVT